MHGSGTGAISSQKSGIKMKKVGKKYTADMTAGSLLTYETRIVAGLLVEGNDFKQIRQMVEKQNVLQKRSIEAAKRMFSLIKNRLDEFDEEFFKLVGKINLDSSAVTELREKSLI